LKTTRQKFFEYKQQQGVFSLEGQQKVLDQRSTELNNEYLTTKNQRQELDTKLAEIDKKYRGISDAAHIRSILDNQSINSIYNTMTALELEQARQSKVLKPKHPKMLQMASEIEKVKDKLKSELEKEVENMRVQRTVLLNREKLMEENIAQFEKDVLDASTKELAYTILQRNMDTSQKLYDTLVAKIKETGVVAGAVASSVRIVETATVPLSPYKPDKKRNLLLGLLLGAFGGVGLAFFREYLDLTIRDEEDIARLLELPVLAVVPIAHKAEKGGY
jgi:polysaccharide biosynthesis transport protein